MKISILAIIIVCTIVLLLNHAADIAVARNDIDDLELVLRDVKPRLSPDSKIAFASTSPDLSLRYKTQFVLAPVVFKDGANLGEQILSVERKGSDPLPTMDSTGLIYSKETKNFRVVLLTRLK